MSQLLLPFAPRCTREKPLHEECNMQEVTRRGGSIIFALVAVSRDTERLHKQHPDAVMLYADGHCFDSCDERMICPWCRIEWEESVRTD